MKEIIIKAVNSVKSIFTDKAKKKSVIIGTIIFLFIVILQILLNAVNHNGCQHSIISVSDIVLSLMMEMAAMYAVIGYMKEVKEDEIFKESRTTYIIVGSIIPFVITAVMFAAC